MLGYSLLLCSLIFAFQFSPPVAKADENLFGYVRGAETGNFLDSCRVELRCNLVT